MTSSSPDPKLEDTIMHAIVRSGLPPAEKTFQRIFEETATVTGAGYETTANALRLTLFHTYTNRTILQRLRQELASAARDCPSEPIPLKALEQLPYLTAVLTEGLRLSPAIGTRAARVADRDLFYRGRRIPAGTPVGMTTLLMHTDPALYPDPMRFDPGRWLARAGSDESDKTVPYAPFSRGTRICLGMQ